jgi:Carboxypeptidase regulatory-like domain
MDSGIALRACGFACELHRFTAGCSQLFLEFRFPFCAGVNMKSRRLSLVVLSLCLVLLACPWVRGQSTYGALTGTVTDSSGAAVAAAQVTLTNLGTGDKRVQPTGDDGLYSFVNLNPGQYRVDVEKAGFKHVSRQPIVVEVQQSGKIDISLQVGSVTETLEVTAETPLLQAETSSLGQVVEERKANELPLNGRNIFNLITVSPAAIAQGGSGGSPVGQNPFSWGNYQVGGSFANQSAEYLDGQPLNIGYINLPIIIPTQDSVGEFKVQYNDLGAEWGKFSGGVINLSTKSGSNEWHGEAYEYNRNKSLNTKGYFDKALLPYVQNQYGFNLGGPVRKDKTFFFTSWEQFRQRIGQTTTTTVPLTAFRNGDFSALLAQGIQLYDPYTVTAGGSRTAYPNNQIPAAEFSKAATTMWDKLLPASGPNLPGITNNYSQPSSIGGNNNQFVARVDQNISNSTRVFGRFTYFGLLDLPTNPFGTGLCQDRCAENYHTKALSVDLNHTFSPTMIGDLSLSGSRFVYARAPILAGYDLTQLGWPASYNNVPKNMRTPPTPAFPFPNDVGRSQGQSFIGDWNTQYNISPSLTIIHGRHTFHVGAQYELGLDNYAQTNIASGAFAFKGTWTAANAITPNLTTGGNAFADFLLGLAQPQGSFVNQTEDVAQVPATTLGRQTYRAFFGDDTWHVSNKLTLNLGLRYELQGPWSERFDRMSYFNPSATNATVTGCNPGTDGLGVAGSPCIGDAALVGTGVNPTRNNIPLDKREFSPRVGFAYSWDQKTVIRGGYGVFFIPNYVSFGLNPDNDVVSLATTPFTNSRNGGLTPYATLDGYNCTLTGSTFTGFACAQSGPFGNAGISLPPGRNATPSTSAFVAANGSPNLAPYTSPKPGYVQQWNFDLQRELPGGFFADIAYAGSKGVHLEQFNTHLNQIPDQYVAQAAAQAAAGQPVTIATQIPNRLVGSPNSTLSAPTIFEGQLLRPYPQYNDVNLSGYGCCDSHYHSLQATVTKRFNGGGTLLAAYTNSKLISNTDTLTSWLEGNTGGVGQVQDWNNLKGEESLSSQDVPQRLVISYVLDLPFGHGRKFMGGATGIADKLIGGWGVDGITTFQRGFPLKITYAGSTPLSQDGFGVSNLRPMVVSGCDRSRGGGGTAGKLAEWFNTSCFAAPPNWGFGNEPRVDSTLRMAGMNNFDFAVFKRTKFGPDDRLGLEIRGEFFNLFNHPQFGPPGTGFLSPGNANGFGVVSSQVNNPRLIQLGGKFVF